MVVMGIDRVLAAGIGLMAIAVGLIGVAGLALVSLVTGSVEIVQLFGPLVAGYAALLLLGAVGFAGFVSLRGRSDPDQ